MKKYLLTGALITITATTLYATTASSTVVDAMKAAAHSFTLGTSFGQTGLTSEPVKGKKTGDMLTAGEWNRVLELVSEGGSGGGMSAPSVISCKKKNSTYATSTLTGQPLVKFTASDCGGTLPDASYNGAIGSLNVCNGAIDHTVYSGGSVNGPGVSFSFRGGYACTWSDGSGYDISVVYMK